MPQRVLAAIHDPCGTIASEEARRRVRRAVAYGPDLHVAARGPLTVGWTGSDVPHASALCVFDGDAPIRAEDEPSTWLPALRASRASFAGLAWHGDRGLVARDHLGARPLFVLRDASATYLASEIPTLLGLLARRPAPDREALALLLAGRPAASGRTVFAGVRALAPAHGLLLEPAGARLERYWSPTPRAGLADIAAPDAAAELRVGVAAAVRRHGGERDGAGVLLSGGLDSSVVLASAAAAARDAGREAPAAFTAVFPEHPRLDERWASRAVAESSGARSTTVTIAGGTATAAARAHLQRWELPLQYPGAAFFQPLLDEAARQGIGLLLDGEGGDELFSCEPLLVADRLLAGDVREAGRLARALPGWGGRLGAAQARMMLPGLISPTGMRRLRRLRGRDSEHPPWLRSAARQAVAAAATASDDVWWRAGRPRSRAHLSWVLTDGRTALGMHDHLRRMTAPSGVVDAHPFLDVDLVELVLGLPPEFAFDRVLDRPLLRRAMAGMLPDPVRLRRDKVYFDALLLAALTGPDRAQVERAFRGPLEVAILADPVALRALWEGGPERHPRGRWAWSAEVWRAYAAEMWLRREAGRGA
jgi:asparagine synthase (glutamine-hydrolysing)